MPEIIPGLGSLDDLPTAKPEAKKRGAKSDSRAAVEQVLALLGKKNASEVSANTTVGVPSAKARAAIETLAQLGTLEEFDATQPNMKALCKDLFDWQDPTAQTRATGAVIKALAGVLAAKTDDGVSLYSQGVEMAAFASAAAPLLQPDRLARLILSAPKVGSAFAPDRYTMRMFSSLKTVIERYPEQRREQLLVSLWELAHDGRFWDATSGITKVRVRNPNGNGNNDEEVARAAQDEIVREALRGHNIGSHQAQEAVTDSLLNGNLPYNPGTRDLIKSLKPTIRLRDGLAEISSKMRAGEPVDPDMTVMISLLPWALPDERPESPICWMVRTLVDALTVDEEVGEARLKELPNKPKDWRSLYPEAEVVGFPYPPAARALDARPMPGCDGVLVEVVKNTAELAANRDYMGNCTYSYKAEMERGTYILLKLWDGQDCYNVAFVANQAGPWRVREINSRHNRGNVPARLRNAADALALALPPRVEADRERAKPREVAFRVGG